MYLSKDRIEPQELMTREFIRDMSTTEVPLVQDFQRGIDDRRRVSIPTVFKETRDQGFYLWVDFTGKIIAQEARQFQGRVAAHYVICETDGRLYVPPDLRSRARENIVLFRRFNEEQNTPEGL